MKDLALSLKRHWVLYLLLALPTAYIIIFHYVPMIGLQIAFKRYNPLAGTYGGEWVGLKHIRNFLASYSCRTLILNTLSISVYNILAGFPVPILLALAINEITSRGAKKFVQMVTYAPHFISTVVLVGMIGQVLSLHFGIVNRALAAMGMERINFMAEASCFKHIFVWSGIWQTAGYSAIVYIAALTGIDPQLYEAATVDGASKLQKIAHVDIPGIMPTAVVMLIMATGRVMSVGFEKAYLLQNQSNISASEIISTYVYKVGLVNADFSYSTAISLFNSVINLILIVLVNGFARKVGETSLW